MLRISRKMRREDWLEIAKNLPCGGKVKIRCCGDSDSMMVNHSERGYSCHCFRCDEPSSHDFVPHGARSIAEINRHKLELKEFKGKPPRLPSDATRDIPVKYAWFLKYGISMAIAKHHGFGWSEFFNRIVIPVMNGDTLEAVHLRAVADGDKPKYLNLGRPLPDAMFRTRHWAGHINNLVVVEDILSAIKVDLAGCNTVSILGSDITDGQVQRILAHTGNVTVWFDNDAAGHKGAANAIKQFKMQGAKVWQVKSDADPKTYNKEQILALMKGATIC